MLRLSPERWAAMISCYVRSMAAMSGAPLRGPWAESAWLQIQWADIAISQDILSSGRGIATVYVISANRFWFYRRV
jgi:hypothetical protein